MFRFPRFYVKECKNLSQGGVERDLDTKNHSHRGSTLCHLYSTLNRARRRCISV